MSKWISAEDRQHLLEEGWLAVTDVVPQELREAAISSICDFLKVDPNDTTSWYAHALGGHGIVPRNLRRRATTATRCGPEQSAGRRLALQYYLWV